MRQEARRKREKTSPLLSTSPMCLLAIMHTLRALTGAESTDGYFVEVNVLQHLWQYRKMEERNLYHKSTMF